jgi:hypothetical protein
MRLGKGIIKEIKIEHNSGNDWTLFIGGRNCGSGHLEDLIEAISFITTEEDAVQFAEECQDCR